MEYNYNIFFDPNNTTFRKNCHPVHLTEDTPLRYPTGIRTVYNAMSYLYDQYESPSLMDIWKEDVGDYYAIRILSALHLLTSQGKEEEV